MSNPGLAIGHLPILQYPFYNINIVQNYTLQGEGLILHVIDWEVSYIWSGPSIREPVGDRCQTCRRLVCEVRGQLYPATKSYPQYPWF